jgi:hypothetical protein
MSRSLSAVATGAVLDPQRTALFIALLAITHDDISTIYVANNREMVTYAANDYLAYPFEMSLPTDQEDRPPQVSLSISNVDRLLIEAIDRISSPPSVALTYVLNGTPPTLEIGPVNFIMRSADSSDAVISMRLTFAAMLDEPFPASVMTPTAYPGVFGGVPEGTTWTGSGARGVAFVESVFAEPEATPAGKRRRRRN